LTKRLRLKLILNLLTNHSFRLHSQLVCKLILVAWLHLLPTIQNILALVFNLNIVDIRILVALLFVKVLHVIYSLGARLLWLVYLDGLVSLLNINYLGFFLLINFIILRIMLWLFNILTCSLCWNNLMWCLRCFILLIILNNLVLILHLYSLLVLVLPIQSHHLDQVVLGTRVLERSVW
jgi:hypothetical protein